MKIRDSSMPDEDYWESLFDVNLILDRLGIDQTVRDVAEVGCGYGTFTIPAAQRIGGAIETFDIDATMVERTRARAGLEGLVNVRAEVRDVLNDGFPDAPGGRDACLLFNILHHDDPVRLHELAARAVREGGSALAIHWNHDPSTPRGPSMDIRPRPEQIVEWASRTGLLRWIPPVLDLPPWHFGLSFIRTEDRSVRWGPRDGAVGVPL
jgi:SAM-dependent methyltransferase